MTQVREFYTIIVVDKQAIFYLLIRQAASRQKIFMQA